ncbi:hypothetical protein SAMN04515667_0543 [Formosa sp. Hel1_31_208]|uniref:hypothetical protein n=1 Tax=Formosa sp. Hel1_31_208 TaxID=1798225 RepID=UPI00087BCEEE|nr:hypothetical protein [Formosa sp. Hel1_31_208]SDR75071.1 hypothetical protein SAMN04515667_0543 [Formosa sp. Hel1_31_208]
MKKALCIILVVIAFACKDDAKVDEQKNQTSVSVAEKAIKELEVIVSFKTNKSDEFKLMLNNVPVDEFQRKNIHVIEKTEPTTSFEQITAKFGNNNLSNNFNINFGTKELKEVEIVSIQMTYGKNSVSIKGTDLESYFNINNYINYDATTGVLKTQKVGGKHYPAISAKRIAINILKKE